jgi:hypothetical protein
MGHSIQSALQQSVHRVLVTLVSFLPGLVAFLLAVVVLAVVGAVLAALTRRVLTALGFDEKLAARQTPGALSNLSEWSPSHSPTLLLSRIIVWACLLAGVAIGIYAFDASFSGSEAMSLFVLPYITHTVGAILILLVGSLLARFVSRTVLIGAVNAQLQYARLLSLGIKWLVLVLAGAMALDHLRVGGDIVGLAFGILFGGIVLTLALAIGLGSRDLVSRSLERNLERPGERSGDTAGADPTATEAARSSLRHF